MSTIALLGRQLLARQQAEKNKAVPVAETLAAALQSEITKAVEAAVQKALQRAPTPRPGPSIHPTAITRMEARLARLEATPVPPPKPAMPEIQMERDGAGLARAVSIGPHRFLVQRGADGRIVRLVPDDKVPEIAYPGPAKINRARR